MKDISVIIPVYNTPLNKLERCIESVLKLKTKYNIEIIVIDDGSEKYINTYFRNKYNHEIIYSRKNNAGVSSARNAGLNIAQGKFVCFVDADDTILVEAFPNLSSIANYQLIIFDMEVVEGNNKHIWKALDNHQGAIDKEDILKELVISNRMNSPCAKLFSNEHIQKSKIRFDEKMITGEDMNFVIDFLDHTTQYYYIERPSYCYSRQESTRISRIQRYPDIYYDNILYLNKRQRTIIDINGMYEYIRYLEDGFINSSFNYLSDLMTLHLINEKREIRVSNEINELHCTTRKMRFKTKLKYKLILNKKWKLIYCLAWTRYLYLKIK